MKTNTRERVITEYQTLYICDYCGKESLSYDDTIMCELQCKEKFQFKKQFDCKHNAFSYYSYIYMDRDENGLNDYLTVAKMCNDCGKLFDSVPLTMKDINDKFAEYIFTTMRKTDED